MLVVIGVAYARTKDPKWRRLSFFWVKVYGLIFAMGVATGIVQEFEFGMNWADYSRFVGNVFGSLLAAEGVFAFFLEGGFLGPAAVRRQPARAAAVAVRHDHRGVRRPLQRPLDHHGQLVDADPAGLHDRDRSGAGTRGHDRLLAGRVHPVVHAPAAARVPRLVDRRGGADDERQRVLRAQEAAPRARGSQPQGRPGRVHPVRLGELRVGGAAAGDRGDQPAAAQAGLDGGALGEHLVRPAVSRGLGGRVEPDDAPGSRSRAC